MKIVKTITAIIMTGVILTGCGSYFEEKRVLDLYQDILKECEWVWENAEEYIEIYYSDSYNGQFAYPDSYAGIQSYALGAEESKYTLCYCIKDINRDKIPELIIGVKCPEEYGELHSATREDGCIIRIIYYYYEGAVDYFGDERYLLNLYKDGILEHQVGVVWNWDYEYYQITEENGLTLLGVFKEDMEDKKEEKHYYFAERSGTSQDEETLLEVTEEEFYEQKNVYTELGEEELEWKVVEGFNKEG